MHTDLTIQHRKRTMKRPLIWGVALAAVGALALTGCAATAEPAAAPEATHEEHHDELSRVAVTYDGGIYVLDGASLEMTADLPLGGFNRLNTAGDGRHAFITTDEGFVVLDTGIHDGHIDGDPVITDVLFEASKAGHVVKHAGKTVLFADGTGDMTIFDTDALPEPSDVEVVTSEAAHHGVALELANGNLLSTLGTDEGRSGVRVLDASRTEIDRNEQCPSVHGEGTVKGEAAVFGCSDGVLVYKNGEFTKLQAPDACGRTGNAYVTDDSTVMVADYNSNPDSEGYLLTELAFVDTVAETLSVVDLPKGVSYTWRGVGRDAHNNAVVLSADGSLYVYSETGSLVESFPVIAPWQSPTEWQQPHPALVVVGDLAYVTEPATRQIHLVDLHSGETLASTTLDVASNEIVVVG